MVGGMYNENSSPTLTNCSFQSNTATGEGGGMSNFGSSPTLTNCVVFGNGGNNTFFTNSGTVTAMYSLFDNTVTGYGGSNNLTTTVNPFVSTTSVALNSCSEAINAGSNAAYTAASGPTTDLAGNARIFPTGGTIDMGAVEFQSTPIQSTGIAGNNGPICSGGNASFTVSGTSGATLTYTITGQSGNQTLSLDGSNQTITANNATADVTLTLASVVLNGCTASLSGSSTVTVNAPTTLTPGPNKTVILGYGSNYTDISAQASGGSGGNYAYLWSQNAGSAATVRVCPQAATTYTVTATDGNGCRSAAGACGRAE